MRPVLLIHSASLFFLVSVDSLASMSRMMEWSGDESRLMVVARSVSIRFRGLMVVGSDDVSDSRIYC